VNLQDFIKTALVEIVSGVADAKSEIEKCGGAVGSIQTFGATSSMKVDSLGRQIHLVEFDIALTDASATDTKGGIGVFLGSVGLGSQGASHGESSSHSRIKFTVPLVLPGEASYGSDK
jgi:hypothetical protein